MNYSCSDQTNDLESLGVTILYALVFAPRCELKEYLAEILGCVGLS